MNLNEIFNNTADVKWQKINSNEEVGLFEVNDSKYKIILKTDDFEYDDKNYSVLNIGFVKLHNDKELTELTNDSKNASKVFGAVSNAVAKKINDYDIDVIIMIARDVTNKRNRIYSFIANRFIGSFGYIADNIDIGEGEKAIIMSRKIPGNILQNIVDRIKKN